MGALTALSELLALSNPDNYSTTIKITQHIRNFIYEVGIKDRWQFEAAAMLSNIGHFVRSSDTTKTGSEKSPDHSDQLTAKVRTLTEAARIIRCIPRLDPVALIIEYSMYLPDNETDWRDLPIEAFGGQLLKIVTEFEELLEIGMTEKEAIIGMRSDPKNYHLQLLEQFEEINCTNVLDNTNDNETNNSEELNLISFEELKPGLVLEEDYNYPQKLDRVLRWKLS